jgi:hypothetical protein
MCLVGWTELESDPEGRLVGAMVGGYLLRAREIRKRYKNTYRATEMVRVAEDVLEAIAAGGWITGEVCALMVMEDPATYAHAYVCARVLSKKRRGT